MKQWLLGTMLVGLTATRVANGQLSPRTEILLSSAPWQFSGAGSADTLPEMGSPAFDQASWQSVQVPHVFQTRANYNGITQGWYYRDYETPAALAGKHLYLVFEGAATIADVYVNGKLLGQHRGAYTRFVFDATGALIPGSRNRVAVKVDNDPKNTSDCLPDSTRLYKVWGGLYRKVWLVAADAVHIDPTDDGACGVYITPSNISDAAANVAVKVLVRNTTGAPVDAQIRVTILAPTGEEAAKTSVSAALAANQRTTLELKTVVPHPQLWAPGSPNLYQVKIQILCAGKLVDELTQTTGFRTLEFNKDGRAILNGKQVILAGACLHQEIESKAAAMDDDDFRANFADMQDLGINFIRLPHYPHAGIEYDLCDTLGIFCNAENGHTNKDLPGSTADRITTEMVKQNYNHPSIAFWTAGNEAGQEVGEREVTVIKRLDTTRPATVANMKCVNADFVTTNTYPGWYGNADLWKFQPKGYISETGAGGVVSTHCDYAAATHRVSTYEPEEYQQLVAEARFQSALHENDGHLGMFLWWCLRDFSDVKYKKPIGINTKGLITYGGDKKDIYYLYRCFLRPGEPTVHITSKRYFVRAGAVDNGIKAYSNAAKLTLSLNGEAGSTLENGKYTHPNGRRVDNVFYWPVPLHTGKNIAIVSDAAGHADSAAIYFYGANGLPELPSKQPLVSDLRSTNAQNTAYFMDMPLQPHWPIYYDLDSTADNSFEQLPPQVQGASWIAMRRLTKAGQESGVSFKLTAPATLFVMASRQDAAPAYLAAAGFEEIASPGLVWRNNALLLVPAQLFARKAGAEEVIRIAQGDRDEIILIKSW